MDSQNTHRSNTNNILKVSQNFPAADKPKIEIPNKPDKAATVQTDMSVFNPSVPASPSNQNPLSQTLPQFFDRSKNPSDSQILEKSGYSNAISETSVSNCLICYDKPPDTVFMNCGHGGICYECACEILQKTGECYLCRDAIIEVLQLDLNSQRGRTFRVFGGAKMETSQSGE